VLCPFHLCISLVLTTNIKRFSMCYTLSQVKYHGFLDAFKIAKEQDKLVHFIMLWGALDDQSC